MTNQRKKQEGFLFRLKNMWKKDNNFRWLIRGIVVFLLITFGILLYAAAFFDSNNYPSFVISLAASFLEDAVFFVLIGIITFLISIKDPSNDDIDKRVRWLFNGSKFNQNTIRYIRDRAIHLAIYSPEHTVTIEFTELNTERNAVKAEIRSNRKFANLMSDVAPGSFTHEYRAVPDLVYEDERPNGMLIGAYVGPENSRRSLIHEGVVLPQGGLIKEASIDIEANGENEFEHVFWVWYKKGEPFSFHVSRYTAQAIITVKNHRESGFKVRLTNLRNNNVRDLAPGENEVYSYQDLDVLESNERTPFKLSEVLQQ